MKTLLAAIAEAFGYFSVIPVSPRYASAAPSPRTLAALPLVGAVIGGASGGAAYAVSSVSSPIIAGAAAFAGVVLLSGAIHVDGFLDSCDAVLASAAPSRRLEILKDPRHGTYAVAGMAVLLFWWIAALAATAPAELPLRLAFACALARASAILPAYIYPYAHPAASAALADQPNILPLVLTIAALAGASFAIAPAAWIAIPICALVAAGIAHWMNLRLGGLVGDSYGFIIAVLEPSILVSLSLHWR